MSIRALKWAYGLFEVLDLPPQERAVLLALCWDHTEKDGCFPSQERLSLLSGYRRRRVQDLLASLESQGLIRRRRVKSGGKWTHTDYRLFGAAMRRRGPVEKRSHHAHSPAGRNHAQTGAHYRGDIYKGQGDAEILEFPIQEREVLGGRS